MGTRAVITFIDQEIPAKFAVYQHWDGDPETIISNLLSVKNCWRWPRWEADEFAAAYILTHKEGPGNIRLSTGARDHGDLSYRYEVTKVENDGECALEVIIQNGDGHFLDVKYLNPAEERTDA